ncbi:MAG: hypothetical protein IJU91_08490 [Selenomonadaceae bacterium]|nr:hypothetical protein [Selenomonadaceae bacterium]
MDDNEVTTTSTNTETPAATDAFSLGLGFNSINPLLIANMVNLPEGNYTNFSSNSYSTSSQSQTINGVTSSSQTSIHTTVDSDGTLSSTDTAIYTDTDGTVTQTINYATGTVVITPSTNWTDILSSYGSFQNPAAYVIGGRQNTNPQNFVSQSSTSYTSANFFDVGNHNGYLSDFTNNNGVINFMGNKIRSLVRQNDFVSFDLENGTSFQAKTADSSESTNDIFQYSEDGQNVYYAKLGRQDTPNTLTYENGINFYGGGNLGNVLRVNETSSTSIFLDGSLGTLFNNINNIDAGESTGDVDLAGNSEDNEIHSGSGNNRIWGGIGGNDKLYGGSGLNTFFYGVSGVNEGNDSIYNSNASDTVNLFNISLTDILSADEIDDNFVINMVDGNSLSIFGPNGASNFVLGQGPTYHYDRATHTWSQVDSQQSAAETQDTQAE